MDGDALSVTNITTSQGTLVNNHNGTWSFTPAHDFNGSLNLNAIITDGTSSINQTLHINVAPVNDAPVVQPLNFNMNEDGTLLITNSQLLAGATDVDGDNLSISGVTVSSAYGTVVAGSTPGT